MGREWRFFVSRPPTCQARAEQEQLGPFGERKTDRRSLTRRLGTVIAPLKHRLSATLACPRHQFLFRAEMAVEAPMRQTGTLPWLDK
jgi:hypothetical protein